MRYSTASITKMKMLLAARLSHILNFEMAGKSAKSIAESLHINKMMIYRLRSGGQKGVSVEAMLEVAKRLECSYTISIIQLPHQEPEVTLYLESLTQYAGRLKQQVQFSGKVSHKSVNVHTHTSKLGKIGNVKL